MIPRTVSGKPGFECVVPLVARENQDRSEREGLLFSRGYIPYFFKHIGNRYKIEDVEKQTFIGFVSTLPELAEHDWTEGNAYQEGRRKYTYANVEDMARSAGFKNKK
jgi:cytochrome oxidase assembly protein ShyY1